MKNKTKYIAFLAIIISYIYFNSDLLNVLDFHETISVEDSGFDAKVVRIIDGDTLEVLKGKENIRIRLAHIDCPEIKSSQSFGKKAKKTLSDLCFGQIVKVEWKGEMDRYGRYIAILNTKNGININQEMVKKGMAWHYKKYSKDSFYAELEKEARLKRIGIWQERNPIPPWNWRKNKNPELNEVNFKN